MNYVEGISFTGGIMWTGENLAGNDAGKSTVDAFVQKYSHEGWTLSIYDELSKSTIEIDCELADISTFASYIYNLEHAAPMTFIGENPLTESYVVGMTCTRGRIDIPGEYKVQDGKLISWQRS